MIEANPLRRVRLDLSYDGSAFFGWARQPARRTVQDVLESALATILRAEVRVAVAGRTDTGVHASGQVAHCDVPETVDLADLLRRLAAVLPPDLRVQRLRVVPATFDARFAAMWRRYEYRVSDARWGVAPQRRSFAPAWPRPLDHKAMNSAAGGLIGLHDFAAYCRRRAGATTVRELQCFGVARDDGGDGGGELICTVVADAFCHSMVRSLVGALLAVGDGRRDPGWPAGLLAREERADEVPVAAAHGLTLVEVGYPPDEQLAARVERTSARRVPLTGRGQPPG